MVLVVLLVLVLYVSLNIFYRNLYDSVSESSSTYLSLYGKDVDASVAEAERLLNDMVYDSSDYVLLQSANEATRYYAVVGLKKEIDNLINTDNSASYLCVAENNYQNFIMAERTHATTSSRDEIKRFMLESVAQFNLKSQWECVKIGNDYYLSKLYVWQGRGAGVFVPINALLTDVQGDANVSIFIKDTNNTLFGYTGETENEYDIGEAMPEQISSTDIVKEYQICGGRYILESHTSIRQMMDQVKFESVLLIIALAVLLLFAVLAARYMRGEVVYPMQHMQENMKQIQEGDYMHRIDEEYPNSEFESLKFTFNKMMDEISDLKIHHYEKQIELSESELRSIRLQIRPHFFLNALTTISSLSMQNKNGEIATYIEALSKNVRYMFKSGMHTVELGEELNHVQNYFEMQELKYPNCVFYFISCSEELYGWRVPQMIIHTIIENEYKYAVSVDSPLSIFINIDTIMRNDEKVLRIEIQDDGKGYPQNVIDELEKNENRSQDGSRVGLWSIKKMLQIMYEEEDLFTISNIEPHGCSNTILIPMEAKHEVGQKLEMKPLE